MDMFFPLIEFSPTWPSGLSWSRSHKVCVCVYVSVYLSPSHAIFFRGNISWGKSSYKAILDFMQRWVLVLLSALVQRCFVSRMRDFFPRSLIFGVKPYCIALQSKPEELRNQNNLPSSWRHCLQVCDSIDDCPMHENSRGGEEEESCTSSGDGDGG